MKENNKKILKKSIIIGVLGGLFLMLMSYFRIPENLMLIPIIGWVLWWVIGSLIGFPFFIGALIYCSSLWQICCESINLCEYLWYITGGILWASIITIVTYIILKKKSKK